MTAIFPSRKVVIIALLGIILVIGLGPVMIKTILIQSLDQKIYQLTQDYSFPSLIQIMKIITHLGDGETFFIFGILFCLAAFFYLGPRPFLFIFLGFFSIRGFTWLLKESIERTRPVSSVSYALGFSFPSGHATNIAFLTVILYWFLEKKITHPKMRKLFVFSLFMLALVVGISRIFLEVHWMSDVIAGYILGLSLGVIMREWGKRVFSHHSMKTNYAS